MIHNFQTENKAKADAALIVYAIYRSRNKERGPSGLGMWGQIERFVKVSAKRSTTLGEFVDKFKRKMACDTISPAYTNSDDDSDFAQLSDDGTIIVKNQEKRRNFMIDILSAEEPHQKEVLKVLYKETQLIVLLVRARLEMEKLKVEEKKK